jgi:hypothetical protein
VIHLALFLSCILSMEIFLRLNFTKYLQLIRLTSKKVMHILPNNKISDHWKEAVIFSYAAQIFKLSFKILVILLCVVFVFIFSDKFINNFLEFTFSWLGVIESIVFMSTYAYLRLRIVSE